MKGIASRVAAGGIALSIEAGDLVIQVDPAKLAAAPELQPIGRVAVYRVPLAELFEDVEAEGGRFWRRVRRWFQ